MLKFVIFFIRFVFYILPVICTSKEILYYLVDALVIGNFLLFPIRVL